MPLLLRIVLFADEIKLFRVTFRVFLRSHVQSFVINIGAVLFYQEFQKKVMIDVFCDFKRCVNVRIALEAHRFV